MRQSDERLVLLAKEPRPGLAKTRLAADLGLDAAHRLAVAFVEDTLTLMGAAVSARADRAASVAYAPDDARGWFERRTDGFLLTPQRAGGLGERIEGAVDDAFAAGAQRVVVMGMDTPHLSPGRIDEAFERLRAGSDVVLGPTEDGGYYLIGLASPEPMLFRDMPWSTARVFESTVMRARAASLSVATLTREFDIDEAADLERLRLLLSAGGQCCGETRQVLAERP